MAAFRLPLILLLNWTFSAYAWRVNPQTDFYDDLQDFIEFNDLKKQLLMKNWPTTITEVKNWPKDPLDASIKQVTGVAVGPDGTVHIFHRGNHVWDERTFDEESNVYKEAGGPIPNDTILVYDANTGKVKNTWGANRFYLPHGITIDQNGNTWLTDVALHQVFKFEPGATEPNLVLGEAMVPGNDHQHFCKPTDVAITSEGTFFVSDGYCNARIIMFDSQGKYLAEIGTKDWIMTAHGLSLDEENNRLYLADRDNYRILCYSALRSKGRVGVKCKDFYTEKEKVGQVFAVAQAGASIFAINGGFDPADSKNHALLQINKKGDVMKTWRPAEGSLKMTHDIALDPKRTYVYVVDGDQTATKKILRNPCHSHTSPISVKLLKLVFLYKNMIVNYTFRDGFKINQKELKYSRVSICRIERSQGNN